MACLFDVFVCRFQHIISAVHITVFFWLTYQLIPITPFIPYDFWKTVVSLMIISLKILDYSSRKKFASPEVRTSDSLIINLNT
jgi:hypothetical protein